MPAGGSARASPRRRAGSAACRGGRFRGRCARRAVGGADSSGGEDGGGEPLRFPGRPDRRPRPGRALPPVQLGAAPRRRARQVGAAERGGHLLPDHPADALQGPQVLPLPSLPGRPRPGLGQGEGAATRALRAPRGARGRRGPAPCRGALRERRGAAAEGGGRPVRALRGTLILGAVGPVARELRGSRVACLPYEHRTGSAGSFVRSFTYRR